MSRTPSTTPRRVALVLVLAGGMLGLLGVGPADAASGDVDVFTPAPSDEVDEPSGIAAGPDGNVWFTSTGSDRVGRITSGGDITTFAGTDEEVIASPRGIVAGPDGNVWFTAQTRIGRVTPSGVITTFDDTPTPFLAWRIAAGPDGNLWFTDRSNDRIGRITPSGVITMFEDPSGDVSSPRGITTGPDGNLWFTSYENDRVGRITPAGVITTFEHPSGDLFGPTGITSGPDGRLWVTSINDHRIVQVTTSGTMSSWLVSPDLDRPQEIVLAPDGNVWVTTDAQLQVGRLAPDLELTVFPSAAGAPAGIAVGPDGDLWFALDGSDQIARVELCSAPFVDVSSSHPFRDDVCWMGAQGVSTGYEDGTYRPSAAVTRQAMSAFMYRLAGEPPFSPPGSPSFVDVGSGHPFFADVEWMAAEEISTGYQDDTFRPSAAVTRQAMSAFMYRLAGEPPFSPPGSPSFSDVGSGHPFFADVEWMAAEEISTGYQDDTFRPSAAVSRQAMSAFMRRLAQGPGVGSQT